MFEWVDRHIRMRIVIIACAALLIASVAEWVLLLAGHLSVYSNTIIRLEFTKEWLWVFLQPLSILMYTLRYWRFLSKRARLMSLICFWLVAAFQVGIFATKWSDVFAFGAHPFSRYWQNVILEFTWVYFPIVGALSWYLLRRHKATKDEQWRCRHLFVPELIILSLAFLTKYTLAHGESFHGLGLACTLTEEFFWLYFPCLGLYCELRGRHKHHR